MLHDDYPCLVESGKQQIKVRKKFNRKTWKQRQLLSESGFVLCIAPLPLSHDGRIKMQKSILLLFSSPLTYPVYLLMLHLVKLYKSVLTPSISDLPTAPPLPRSVLVELMQLATSVEFSFNNTMHRPTNGVAMGSPFGPALANIHNSCIFFCVCICF